MAFYVTILAQALIAAALVAALWPAAMSDRAGGGAAHAGWAVAAGALGGGTAALAAGAAPKSATAIAVAVNGAAMALAALALLAVLTGLGFAAVRRRSAPVLPGGRAGAVAGAVLGFALTTGLAAAGTFAAWRRSADHALSATDVINTELIVNCAAIVIGLAALLLLSVVTHACARLAGRAAALAALAVVLLLVPAAGAERVMLDLLRLDLVRVTAGRVSFVARLSVIVPWLAFGHLLVALALAALAFRNRFRIPSGAGRVEGRRLKARAIGERRWRNGLVGTAVFLIAVMAYQDLYASRPPSLSKAVPVTPDAAGQIRIPVAEVKDGNLHRFAYIASDGHRIRFFLINRYDEAHAAIGVVFDACMICGDEGYVQRGQEIICIACNVRIFRPSIGKPGGCNPIPLNHGVEDGVIVIADADLEKGVRYFSEVVEMEVTDPVSGGRLLNSKAPHQYEHGGRTYFFEGQSTYERFRAAPEAYVKGRRSRAPSDDRRPREG